jgi:hypothetical protein
MIQQGLSILNLKARVDGVALVLSLVEVKE